MKKVFTILLFLFLFSSSFVYASEDIPVGLQKIKEYNQQLAQDSLKNISFAVAFLAGILTVLSPCILPLLPAYFSYTFKEKKNITKMTLFFFLGFSVVFLIFGVIAALIGSMTVIALKSNWLVFIASSILIIMGVLMIFNKGFTSFLHGKRREGNDPKSVFVNGMLFAVGWSACVGPILSGVLSIAVVLGNVFTALYLMFFYSLGILFPLFLISILYDKYNLAKHPWIKGKSLSFTFFGNQLNVHSTNLIAGSMLILLGVLFIINNQTGVINGLTIYATKQYFFSIQEFLQNWTYTSLLGMIIFFGFLILLFRSLRRKK